jgi:hypothetical protein
MNLFDLQKIKLLGFGCYGYVYLVKYRNKEYALKVSYINLDDQNNDYINIKNEEILNKTIFKKYPNQFTKLIKISFKENCDEITGSTNMINLSKYKTCIYRLYSVVDTIWKNIDLSKFSLKVKYSMFIQLYNIYNILDKKKYIHGDILDKNIGIKYTTDKFLIINNKEIPTFGIYIQMIDYDKLVNKETSDIKHFKYKQKKDKDNIIMLMSNLKNFMIETMTNIESSKREIFYNNLRNMDLYKKYNNFCKYNTILHDWLVLSFNPQIYKRLLNNYQLKTTKLYLPKSDILNIVKLYNHTDKIIDYLINKLEELK